MIPLIFQRELVLPKVARWQPYVFGIGVAGISLFMMGAGTLGVASAGLGHHLQRCGPRLRLSGDRVPDDGAERDRGPARGDRRPDVRRRGGRLDPVRQADRPGGGRRAAPSAPRAAEAVAEYGSAGTWHLPGTYVLVAIFFTAFALYYFVNWKYLSEIWPMS